jgi:DNA-binding transcriptional LysR family regulator
MHDPSARLNWDDLRLFLAAARAGGFGAAGRSLQVEQSTVSRRVAALERALGAALFDRSSAGLLLTQFGRQVLVEAEAVEGALRRVAELSCGEERAPVGLVRVAVSETMACTFLLPRVLPALLERHPGLRIDLVIGDAPADLGRREADIAIRFFLARAGDLVTRRVATLATAVVAEKRLARTLRATAPATWPWVSAWLRDGPVPEEGFRSTLTSAPARVTMNSFQAQWAAVRAGLGVAVLPRVLIDGALTELALAPGTATLPSLPVYLATPRTLRRVPRIAAVFDALASALAELGSPAAVAS